MNVDLAAITEKIAKWGNRTDFLIEILQDIQDEYQYLPREALREVSRTLGIPLNKVYEVATYYKAFSLEPKGRFKISICQGTACHVQGAHIIRDSFERELGIKIGETDSCKDFSIEEVRCIGCCGLAPVVTINEDVLAKFDPSKVKKTLDEYRKKPRNGITKKNEAG